VKRAEEALRRLTEDLQAEEDKDERLKPVALVAGRLADRGRGAVTSAGIATCGI
jgi:hypothetical protein